MYISRKVLTIIMYATFAIASIILFHLFGQSDKENKELNVITLVLYAISIIIKVMLDIGADE